MSHSELVERWVYVEQNERNGMERFTSAVVHSSADPRRVKSAQNTKRDFQQPVESLTVSFSKLLVDHTEQHSPKKKKKRPASSKSVRNNRPVTQIDHVEEWLHQRSAHYAWWRKPQPDAAIKVHQAPKAHQLKTSLSINRSLPHRAKSPRCVLWFEFTGNPRNGCPVDVRTRAIRIEQQPLGGANALVFVADLRVGEEFAVLSRRQPGFTFSLTFYIDGVRHARLSGCCEKARNLHVPTRVGGPIGAFVLRSVQGGESCQVCEKSAPPPDPRLFTVRPKTETSRRRSVKRAAHAESTTDAAATLNDAPSEEHDAPSLDTFAPCTESIEEAYDVDGADVDFTAASISIEDVIHIISPGAHTPPGISIDSCD